MVRWASAHKVWAAVIALVVVMCACGGIFAAITGGGGSTAPTQVAGATNTATKPQPTATVRVYKVGDTHVVDDVWATLVSVKPIAGDEFTQPKSGNAFYVVHVKIINHSHSEQSYNPLDFHVRTSSGNISDVEIVPPSTYTANNTLNSGNLTAGGGTVEGDLIIQAPTGDHGAKLSWQPSFFGNTGDNTWLLGL